MKVLKIGGSFITDKAGYRKAVPANIALIAKAVASVWRLGVRDFIVVHGAGSFGHALVLKHGIDNGVKGESQMLGYADTHAACSELSLMLVKAFIDSGVPAVSIPPAVVISQKNKRIAKFDEGVVKAYFERGYLPVLYGDMVPDSELGGSVCSGDQVAAWLGRKAECLVLATNVDGVLDSEGRLVREISRKNFGDVSKHLKAVENDVTGGMRGKIAELLGLDTVSYIVNAGNPERVEELLMGKETICTMISPKR